jgi:pyridoxine 5'-phosphate synthase PdxJ
VPEKREEVTTEGGLDVVRHFDAIKKRSISSRPTRSTSPCLLIPVKLSSKPLRNLTST